MLSGMLLVCQPWRQALPKVRSRGGRCGSPIRAESYGTRAHYRYTGTLVHRDTDTLIQWYTSTVVTQYTGTPVQQHTGTPVHRYTSTPIPWYTGTPAHWYTGTSVHSYVDEAIHWYIGIPIHRHDGTLSYARDSHPLLLLYTTSPPLLSYPVRRALTYNRPRRVPRSFNN